MLPLNMIEAHFCGLKSPLPLQIRSCLRDWDRRNSPRALRKWLLDDAVPLRKRDAIWTELIQSAREAEDTEQLTLLLLGFAVPGLRRAVNRAKLQSPGTERADLEAEAIAGFIAAIPKVDLARSGICSQLCQAAHTTARILGRSNRRQRHEPETELFLEEPEYVEAGHLDFILARAVTSGVIDRMEANLIGDTRLDGERLTAYARRHGETPLSVGAHRRRAEERLRNWLVPSVVGT